MNGAIEWTPRAQGGFEDKANGLVLAKVGKVWWVTRSIGMRTLSQALGKKASFDHAEAAAVHMMTVQ